MKRPVQISSLADMSKPLVSCTLPLCPINSFSTQNIAETMQDLKKGRFLSTGNSDGCPLNLTWAVPRLMPWTNCIFTRKSGLFTKHVKPCWFLNSSHKKRRRRRRVGLFLLDGIVSPIFSHLLAHIFSYSHLYVHIFFHIYSRMDFSHNFLTFFLTFSPSGQTQPGCPRTAPCSL